MQSAAAMIVQVPRAPPLSWSICPHLQHCAVRLLSHTLELPAEIHSGDLVLSANGMADEKMLASATKSPGAHVSCPEATTCLFQLN